MTHINHLYFAVSFQFCVYQGTEDAFNAVPISTATLHIGATLILKVQCPAKISKWIVLFFIFILHWTV